MSYYEQPRLNGPRSWLARFNGVLSVAIGLAIAFVVVVLALGLALVLIPVAAAALIFGAWQLRRWRRAMAARMAEMERRSRPADPNVIEGEYTVVE